MAELFTPKNIIVTGGCGFIGSNFVHYVVNNCPDVHVIVPPMVLETMGKDADDFDWVRDRPDYDCRYAIDSTKLRTELNWRLACSGFAEGLKQTINWYVTDKSWSRPAKGLTEAKYAKWGR